METRAENPDFSGRFGRYFVTRFGVPANAPSVLRNEGSFAYMSVKIMSLVWEHAPYTAGSLLILLALADWANDDGVAWPSMERLAKKARIDRRSAQRIVRQLEKDGVLEIEHGGGRAKQHKYVLKIETATICRPLAEETATPTSPFREIKGDILNTERATSDAQRATFHAERATPTSPKPLVDPLEEPSREPKRDFLSDLKADPFYSHVDFDTEAEKMQRWLARPENKGRRMTERFVMNWINKIDRPVVVPPALSGNGSDRSAKEAELKRKMGWDRL